MFNYNTCVLQPWYSSLGRHHAAPWDAEHLLFSFEGVYSDHSPGTKQALFAAE